MQALNQETSSKFLKRRVQDWLSSAFPGLSYAFFSSGEEPDRQKEALVVFGDFLPAVAELIAKDAAPERIFVLCARAKLVLASFFGGIEDKVFVIPLAQTNLVQKPSLPSPKRPWTMVYAGRFCGYKNIHLLIHVVQQLQARFNEDVQLLLVGSFTQDAGYPYWAPGAGYFSEERIKREISELEWKRAPIIHAQMDPDHWPALLDENSAFISLSEHCFEDFGVAAIQALEKGRPLILSDVGGHEGYFANGAYKVPRELFFFPEVARFADPWELAAALAPKLAGHIHQRFPKSEAAPKVGASPGSSNWKAELKKLKEDGIDLAGGFKFQYLDYSRVGVGVKSFWDKYYRSWIPAEIKCETIFYLSPAAMSWPSMSIAMLSALEYWRQCGGVGFNVAGAAFSGVPNAAFLDCKRIIFFGLYDEDLTVFGKVKNVFPHIQRHIYLLDHPSHGFRKSPFPAAAKGLDSKDVLVANGVGDSFLTKSFFPEMDVKICRFNQRSKKLCLNEPKQNGAFYAGRLSEQKALHYTLWALHLLKKTYGVSLPFVVYGIEDRLGVPELGVESRGYETFLVQLARTLNIDVSFRGAAPHSKVARYLAKHRPLVLNPSLHWDENYGLLARDAVSHGCLTVCSHWGGLRYHQELFPQLVKSVPVYFHSQGLTLCPRALAFKIGEALKEGPGAPGIYPDIHLEGFDQQGIELELKLSDSLPFKVADDWEVLKRIWSSYGARPLLVEDEGRLLAPWCQIDPKKKIARVNDPLLPKMDFSLTGALTKRVELFDGTTLKINEDVYKRLLNLGQIK